jgi:ribonucleoside-diphosphate reductase alpha chain
VSSGGEPVFALEQRRTVNMQGGKVEVDLNDYAYTEFGTVGRTADEVTPQEHIDVLCAMQKYTDSAVSKTCNVYGQKGGKGPGLTFEEFKSLYMQAYDGGAKGCTTFNSNGKRMGILQAKPVAEEQQNPAETASNGTDGMACFFDPATGMKTCE